MRATLFSGAAAALLVSVLFASPVDAQTRVNPMNNGTVSVEMRDCTVLLAENGRILTFSNSCEASQLEEAREAFQRSSRAQGGGRGEAEWFVTHDARNNLEVLSRPSMRASIVVDGIRDGTRVRNLGCEAHEGDTWCRVEVGRELGWARIRYLRPDDGGGIRSVPSPEASSGSVRGDWVVTHGARNNLEVLSRPSMSAPIVVDGIRDGTRLRNLGCERHEADTWCRVEVGREVGWARIRYLADDDGSVRSTPSSSGARGLSDRLREASGEPSYWQVANVRGRLRIKDRPENRSGNVAEVGNGTLLVNRGCSEHGGDTWCRIEYEGKGGWVRRQYLEPA